MIRLIGIDPSLASTGVVVYLYDPLVPGKGTIEFQETIGFSLGKNPTIRDQVRRIRMTEGAVRRVIRAAGPIYAVAVEGPSYGSRFTPSTELGGIRYAIYGAILDCGHEPEVFAPKEARLKAFGSAGPAKNIKAWIKSELMKVVEEVPKNEHTRDALVQCLAMRG